MVNVKKADGSLKPFDRDRVFKTCRRMRLSDAAAKEVVKEIEKSLYEGIPTKKVFDMILDRGRKHRPQFGHIIDLREALGMMRPKPDFEQFVALLMESKGYKTVTNKIVQGRCIDHEIDTIAIKGSEIIYVEVKHHNQFHTFTGMGTILEINSVFQDLVEGYAAGKNKYNFTKAMLVTNTKVSNHAESYSSCRDIDTLAWDTPKHEGIESYIHGNMIYPVSVLKDLSWEMQAKLGDNGVYTLKQLLETDKVELSKVTGISRQVLDDMAERASQILGS